MSIETESTTHAPAFSFSSGAHGAPLENEKGIG
jgi:hypothetical protein